MNTTPTPVAAPFTFIHVTDTVQYAYSSGRNAIAEYRKWETTGDWHLDGWLHDGQVRDLEDAKAKLAEVLGHVWTRS